MSEYISYKLVEGLGLQKTRRSFIPSVGCDFYICFVFVGVQFNSMNCVKSCYVFSNYVTLYFV